MADDLKQRFEELEARISKGLEKGWVSKAFEHFDERLSSLEKGPTKAKDETKTDSDDSAAKKDAEKPESKSGANYMTIEEYEKRKFSYEEEHYAIDVVVGQRFRKQARTGDAKEVDATTTTTTDDKGNNTRPNYDLPRLIQINSEPLTNLLKLHTWSEQGKANGPYVILAPFKSLCFNIKLLRDVLLKWVDGNEQGAYSEQSPQPATDACGETSEAENNGSSQRAWQDLKCLLEVYDVLIRPWWDYMRSSAPRHVQYGDLCALYQPGDLVVTPDAPQRVYRVIKITGGRPRLHHLCSTKFGHVAGATEGDRDEGVQSTEATEEAKSGKGPKTRPPPGDHSTNSSDWSVFDIDCYSLVYNGKTFGPVQKSFQLAYFPGHRDLRRLKPYPARFMSDKLRSDYIADGKSFLVYSRAGLRAYDGRTLTRMSDGSPLKLWTFARYDETILSRDVDEDIVIDFDLTYQYNPKWEIEPQVITYDDLKGQDQAEDHTEVSILPTGARLHDSALQIEYFEQQDETQFNRWWREDIWLTRSQEGRDVKHEQWNDLLWDRSEDEYMLLPTQVFGYILRTQEWACFDVTNKATWNDSKKSSDNWDELQLPAGHKQTLSSQMEWHLNNRKHGTEPFSFDFIEGKGEGLIILLHGAPGVGKTSTGESLARLYGKPLLPITCGNLGLNARAVESALTDNFRLAEAWNCIVLLDEADIFLARREKKDLERNALVSVFLRTLEYYTGILILTTNRPGDFDEAFRSRINVGLHYPHLTKDMTKAIWESSLARLERHLVDGSRNLSVTDRDAIIRFGERHYEAYRTKLSRSPWNGRQIRNAFQSAVALAQHKAYGSRSLSKSGRADSMPPEGAKAVLTWEIFREVALATLDFEIYLVETHGGWTDDEIAAGHALRAIDGFGHEDGTQARHTAKERRKIKPEDARDVIKKLHPDMRPFAPEPSPFSDPFLERRPTMYARIASNGTPVHGNTHVPPPGAYASPAAPAYYNTTALPAAPNATPMGYGQLGQYPAAPTQYNASPQPYYSSPQPPTFSQGQQLPTSNLQSPPPQFHAAYQAPTQSTAAPGPSAQYQPMATQATQGGQQQPQLPSEAYPAQISANQPQYQPLPVQATQSAPQPQMPPGTQYPAPMSDKQQPQYQPAPVQPSQIAQ